MIRFLTSCRCFSPLLSFALTLLSLPVEGGETIDLAEEVSNTIRVYGAAPNERLGSGVGSVATGDFNGDGFADLIMGAPFAAGVGDATAAGRVSVQLGKEQLQSSRIDLNAATDIVRIFGNGPFHRIGFSVASGDVNGDGFDDAVIGIPSAEVLGATRAGRVGVVFGRSNAEGAVFRISDPTGEAATAWIVGATPFQKVGWSVATGDVNSDGFADVIVGSQSEEVGPFVGRGEAFVVFGHAHIEGEVVPLGSESADDDMLKIRGGRPDRFDANGDQLGADVASGDVNGDGYDDVIVGAPRGDGASDEVPDAGEVVVVYGGESLAGVCVDLASPTGSFGETRIHGARPFDTAGLAVAAGDVNGDGFYEVIIGVPFADFIPGEGSNQGNSGASGEVHILFGDQLAHGSTIILPTGGQALGPGESRIFGYRNAATGTPFASPTTGGLSGWNVAAGDVDGDGRDDLVVGGPFAGPITNFNLSQRRSAAGMVHTLTGGQLLPATSLNLDDSLAPVEIWGEGSQHRLGQSVAVGDLNLDGFMELIAVAPQAETSFEDSRPSSGAAYALISSGSVTESSRTTFFRAGNPPKRSSGNAIRCILDFGFASEPAAVSATLVRKLPPGFPLNKAEDVLPVHWVLEGGSEDFSLNLSLRYLNTELGERDEARLAVYASATGAPGTWQKAGGVQLRRPNQNVIEVLGLNQLGFFSLAIEAPGSPTSVLKLF